jgi:hypothetical protein
VVVMRDRSQWGNPRNDLDRTAQARVAELARARLGCLPLAALCLAAVCLGLLVASTVARADGPPQHGPIDCDPVCVVDYCRARCDGPGERTEDERRACRRECVPYVTNNGCWPCREDGQ